MSQVNYMGKLLDGVEVEWKALREVGEVRIYKSINQLKSLNPTTFAHFVTFRDKRRRQQSKPTQPSVKIRAIRGFSTYMEQGAVSFEKLHLKPFPLDKILKYASIQIPTDLNKMKWVVLS